MKTAAEDFALSLQELLDMAPPHDGGVEDIRANVKSVRTFHDAQLLTDDAGIVVRMQDGSEYQISVVRSK